MADLLEQHLDPAYEVAARRRKSDPPSPRERRTGVLSRSLVLLTIGVLLATAYARASADAPEAARARAALAADARKEAALTDTLQRDAVRLRSRVSAERASALEGNAAGSQAQARLTGLEVAAGLVSLRGTGLVVTVTDAGGKQDPVTGEAPATDPSDAGKVQDRDLAAIVNALWESGAEAISVDGQRLSPTSTIRAAGQAILVDFRPVSSPYELRAIGHAGPMQERFTDSQIARAFGTFVQLYGMKFSIRRSNSVVVGAAPATGLTFAAPQGGTR